MSLSKIDGSSSGLTTSFLVFLFSNDLVSCLKNSKTLISLLPFNFKVFPIPLVSKPKSTKPSLEYSSILLMNF